MRNLIFIIFICIGMTVNAQLTNAQLEALWQQERTGFFNDSDPNINPNLGLTVPDTIVSPSTKRKGTGFQSAYLASKAYYSILMHWKATGQQQDFDDLKRLIDIHIEAAIDVQVTEDGVTQTFKGWPSIEQCAGSSNQDQERCAYGTPLWEFFIWRDMIHFLSDIHLSPALRAQVELDYPGWFQGVIDWTTLNIFEKWRFSKQNSPNKDFGNYYRNRTHIAMEAAEYCLYLNSISGNSEALIFAREIIEDGMNIDIYKDLGESPNGTVAGNNFTDQLRLDSANNLYLWNWGWNGTNGATQVQDVDHWGHFVSSIIAARHFDYLNDIDMIRFKNTMDVLAMISYNNYAAYKYVDGTGTEALSPNTAIRLFRLGEYDQSVNNKIANGIDNSDANKHGYAAIVLYNQKILDDGRPMYPTHYQPLDGPFGGTDPDPDPDPDPTPDPDPDPTPDPVPSPAGMTKKDILKLIYH